MPRASRNQYKTTDQALAVAWHLLAHLYPTETDDRLREALYLTMIYCKALMVKK